MITQNDLLDIRRILCNFRCDPLASENEAIVKILLKTINDNDVFENRIRISLSKLAGLDRDKWSDMCYSNKYPYTVFIKDDNIYRVLNYSLLLLLDVLKERNEEKIYDLCDALHELPLLICENKYLIPKSFYKKNVKYYRKKWDKRFLSNV